MKKDEKALTKRQKSTMDRRTHIVRQAAVCFIEEGFHKTSMRDIAQRADVSIGNLYNHFSSKSDLISEIAGLEADELDDVRAVLDASTPDIKALGQFCTGYFTLMSKPENAVLTAEITAEAMRDSKIADGFVQNRTELLDGLERVLSHIRTDYPEPARDLARLLLNMIEATATDTAFASQPEKTRALSTLLYVVQRTVRS